MGITLNLSMAYHPQTNSHTEYISQEVEVYLRGVIKYAQLLG
jgi:hypothetical protein